MARVRSVTRLFSQVLKLSTDKLIMKIRNLNAWLPKPYYVATLDGECIGTFSTPDEAQDAYEVAKAKAEGVKAYVLPCGSLLTGPEIDCLLYVLENGLNGALSDPRDILSIERDSITVSGANESRHYAFPIVSRECVLFSLDN